MSDNEPTSRRETLPTQPESGTTSEPTVVEGVAERSFRIASTTSVFIRLANLSDHGRARQPAEDATTARRR